VTSTVVALRKRSGPQRLAGQLSLYDEVDLLTRGPMRRLGEGRAIGELLLQPLLLRGWRLHEPFPGFAGDGFVFILERGGVEVRRTGSSLAEVAVDLFEEAAGIGSVWDGGDECSS
jgi:hypothetical protein